jgi:hypothetical protein
MSNHKLAIVVPYRDRREHLDIFLPHIQSFLKDKNIDYKIFVIEQSDDKPFNYGKLCNSAFHLLKDEYDYFCFHDVDMLPSSDKADYSYKQYPTHLATRVQVHENTLPYLQYLGGVLIIPKEDFILVNGYSNEYYGWGYADLDLLFRMEKAGVKLDSEYIYPRVDTEYEIDRLRITDSIKKEKVSYLKFDGETQMEVLPNKFLKGITTDSFTISAWINFDDFVKEEQYVVSFPGFNSGISIQPDNTLRFNFWGKDNKYYFNYRKLKPNQWHHIVCNVDFDSNKLRLIVDTFEENKKVDTLTQFELPLWDYTKDKIYIGCGSHGKNMFRGKLANLYMFDYTLSDSEIKNLYLNGLINNRKLQTQFEPTLKYQFNNFYKNFVMDGSKHHNHSTLYNTHGSNYSEYLLNDEIIKTSKIKLPKRIEANFQSLPHENDTDIVNRFKSFDPDIIENGLIFFNDILTEKFSTTKIGLNNLKFKLIKQETFDKQTEWLKIIL